MRWKIPAWHCSNVGTYLIDGENMPIQGFSYFATMPSRGFPHSYHHILFHYFSLLEPYFIFTLITSYYTYYTMYTVYELCVQQVQYAYRSLPGNRFRILLLV